jgi:hypothetical protein
MSTSLESASPVTRRRRRKTATFRMAFVSKITNEVIAIGAQVGIHELRLAIAAGQDVAIIMLPPGPTVSQAFDRLDLIDDLTDKQHIVVDGDRVVYRCTDAGKAWAFATGFGAGVVFVQSRYQANGGGGQ